MYRIPIMLLCEAAYYISRFVKKIKKWVFKGQGIEEKKAWEDNKWD